MCCQSKNSARSRALFGCSGCGASGYGVSKSYVQNPSPISALGVKSPHLKFLRVNQLSFSSPTSSNTTSLHPRNPRILKLSELGECNHNLSPSLSLSLSLCIICIYIYIYIYIHTHKVMFRRIRSLGQVDPPPRQLRRR